MRKCKPLVSRFMVLCVWSLWFLVWSGVAHITCFVFFCLIWITGTLRPSDRLFVRRPAACQTHFQLLFRFDDCCRPFGGSGEQCTERTQSEWFDLWNEFLFLFLSTQLHPVFSTHTHTHQSYSLRFNVYSLCVFGWCVLSEMNLTITRCRYDWLWNVYYLNDKISD